MGKEGSDKSKEVSGIEKKSVTDKDSSRIQPSTRPAEADSGRLLSFQEVEQILEHTRGAIQSWIGSSPREAFQRICRSGCEGIDQLRFFALLYRCKPGLREQDL